MNRNTLRKLIFAAVLVTTSALLSLIQSYLSL